MSPLILNIPLEQLHSRDTVVGLITFWALEVVLLEATHSSEAHAIQWPVQSLKRVLHLQNLCWEF